MAITLSTSQTDFEVRFAALLAAKREVSEDVGRVVAAIIARVRAEGDRALIKLSAELDEVDLEDLGIQVTDREVAAAVADCDKDVLRALHIAHDRILVHHERQRPADRETYRDALGVELGHRWTAVQSVGVYVPGGLASYPSSVLMNTVPAKVAGVPRLVMAVPAPGGRINPLVLAAAGIGGAHEIYRVGGAQAIAALAYGTGTIAPVAKIVGPGNAYVAAAKRQVFGQVGIDSIAGPSEVLVIADAANDPSWIAADLLAQAEHDVAAQSLLMTDDAAFAAAVEGEVRRQLASLPKRSIAQASWDEFGAMIILRSIEEAAALADRIAAEHLQIATRDPDAVAARITNAGAIFLGAHTPEVIGDYVAGSNHVLPTARSARYASGLGVLDFMKRTSLLRLDADALARLAEPAMALARAEGLEGHRRAVEVRIPQPPGGRRP